MTSRATDMGFFIFCIQATDPQFNVFPSIITASISTSPSVFKTEPVPVKIIFVFYGTCNYVA